MAGPRRARLVAGLAIAVLVVAGCATATSPGSSTSKTIRPSDSSGVATGPTSPVVGIVTSVDPVAPPLPSAAAGKTPKPSAKPAKTPASTASPSGPKVLGFTLLTTTGDTLTFVIGELDNVNDFPPQSLYDRVSSEDPIRVDFTVDGNKLVATHIEDAG
jgi:hypothetical protein